MEILGIIPARGGSKGIPRKNLALLGGKPLLAWTIEAAQQSNITRLIVTTEDEEIADCARGYNVEVHARNPEYSGDDVHAVLPTMDALATLFDREKYRAAAVMMLLPTSPFRTAKHIDDAIRLWQSERCEAVCGVYRLEDHGLDHVRTIGGDGYLQMYCNPAVIRQRQNAIPLYRVNGAIFLAAERDLVRNRTFHQQLTVPYVMGEMASLEIDTPADLERARNMVEAHNYVTA